MCVSVLWLAEWRDDGGDGAKQNIARQYRPNEGPFFWLGMLPTHLSQLAAAQFLDCVLIKDGVLSSVSALLLSVTGQAASDRVRLLGRLTTGAAAMPVACVQPLLSTHVEGRSLSVGHVPCRHESEGMQHHRGHADLSFPPTHTYTETRRRGTRRVLKTTKTGLSWPGVLPACAAGPGRKQGRGGGRMP
jgi:hypothetical protein